MGVIKGDTRNLDYSSYGGFQYKGPVVEATMKIVVCLGPLIHGKRNIDFSGPYKF